MDELVFIVVVLARFIVPLAIPRFPLPSIVLALVIDAADQTIFAAFDVEPDNYQGYDKALDIYYLTVAYISTIRNWTDGAAFRIGQFLWYYRLVGVVAFELTGARSLLLIFPNTFEYYFIFYEAVRLWWAPTRMSRRFVLGAAAAIWVVIKLPQEYWIHIAQLDVTDVLGDNPWLWPMLGLAAAIAGAATYRQLYRLPPTDWPTSFDVNANPTTVLTRPTNPVVGRWALLDHPLVEKTLLVGLVLTIFLQLVPQNDASVVAIMLGSGVVIGASSFLGHWLSRRGTNWTGTAADFFGTGVINLGIVLVLRVFTNHAGDGAGSVLLTLFLVGLLTLVVTLYDRYRELRLTRGGLVHANGQLGVSWR